VTISVPPGFTSLLIGCKPYHAHDSTPLKSVSSTQIETSTSFGSYFAIPSSSVTSSVATMANALAGIPLRSGLSPYRPNEMPGFPSLCAARTMARLMFFARVFWKMPR